MDDQSTAATTVRVGKLRPGTKLHLPALEVKRERTAIGWIRHVVRGAREAEIEAVREIQVSPRRQDPLCVLDSGESIVVTVRNNVTCPSEAEGVLKLGKDGDSRWLQHSLLDECEKRVEHEGWGLLCQDIARTWDGVFQFRAEKRSATGDIIVPGFRPPQLGALHGIGAHWSQSLRPATVVMPTGTGKTEVVLATLVAYARAPILVVVPSQALREQTVQKFLTLGLLRELGLVPEDVPNPVVGVVTKCPRSEKDLEAFEGCNVIVSTMSALTFKEASEQAAHVAERVTTLVVDEAHHVPAATWWGFREHFAERSVLQFTATPFRRDGKLVDGKVVYSYPLRQAQEDGYFKSIRFQEVYEIDPDDGDRAIAEAAIEQLRHDDEQGLSHIVMARCETIERARAVHGIYEEIGRDYAPVLVHSKDRGTLDALTALREGDSRIVVCVDMLGEGFDLPNLKIAAVHDTHKSLGVVLQFTGRFTRTAGSDVGNATVIANIANQDVSAALERLYSEDADWNHLLSEFSSQAIREHAELVEFLSASKAIGEQDEDEHVEISRNLLRPKFSAAVFKCDRFRPKKFHEGLPANAEVHQVWFHEGTQTLYFVLRSEPQVRWSRSKQLRDRQWDLFVLHYDAERKLLYLHSSDTSSLHEGIARAVGGEKIELIHGDTVFRTLGNIKRLVFQNIGVRKYGRRNLRYAMYTGSDVKEALTASQKAGSVKSNLSGTGYETGHPVTIGCSYKGRVWSREQGPVPRFIRWCAGVGEKLIDESIDTSAIIENVLIPEEVDTLPDATLLALEWPMEIIRQSQERVLLKWSTEELPLSLFDLTFACERCLPNELAFTVSSDSAKAEYVLRLGGTRGYQVVRTNGKRFAIQAGRIERPLEEYLSDYPPLARFTDMSELDGNLLVRPKDRLGLSLPAERFEPWDWKDTNISQESLWKGGKRRPNSIQGRAADHFREGGFELIFDDDHKGEAADLVCMKEEDESIRLALVHCKFSGDADPGRRVSDVVEVCSQAVRSAKWVWRFRDLCRHITVREKRLRKPNRTSRFLAGEAKTLNQFLRMSRFKDVRAEIVIVQPGLSQGSCSAEQMSVLAAADSFLTETVGVHLDVVCSE